MTSIDVITVHTLLKKEKIRMGASKTHIVRSGILRAVVYQNHSLNNASYRANLRLHRTVTLESDTAPLVLRPLRPGHP